MINIFNVLIVVIRKSKMHVENKIFNIFIASRQNGLGEQLSQITTLISNEKESGSDDTACCNLIKSIYPL